MTNSTAVSLFAGVGGFDLALERAGVKVVAAVEIDKNARGVLAKQFPNTKLFNDVTTVTGKDLQGAGFIPEHGIITGGFPCQDLSVAGKRAGLAGKRSGLYWEIIRLVDELTPKHLVLENVFGLLSSNGGRDMGTVIGALTDRGYDVAWRVLDAQYFGVAQRRRRVFIVGCLGDPERASEILALSEGLRGDTPTRRKKGKETSGDVGDSLARMRGFGYYKVDSTSSSVKARDSEDATDLVVGQVTPATVRRLTPTECERLQGFPDGWTAERIDETKGLIPQADSNRYKQMGNAVAVPVVEWIVDRLVTYENNY